jgi:hypothetical protein
VGGEAIGCHGGVTTRRLKGLRAAQLSEAEGTVEELGQNGNKRLSKIPELLDGHGDRGEFLLQAK